MRQRGRKDRFTQAAPMRNVAAFSGGGVSAPPEGLPDAAQAIWRRVVSAMPSGWFTAEHVDLLEGYCRHLANAQKFWAALDSHELDANDPDSVIIANRLSGMGEREQRAALALARSMRITHQSTDARVAARRKAKGGHGVDWGEL